MNTKTSIYVSNKDNTGNKKQKRKILSIFLCRCFFSLLCLVFLNFCLRKVVVVVFLIQNYYSHESGPIVIGIGVWGITIAQGKAGCYNFLNTLSNGGTTGTMCRYK